MKNYKEKQINFCWTPFGYSYSVPLSLGYLKSSLTENGFKNVKVIDFNQDFWYRNKEELGMGLNWGCRYHELSFKSHDPDIFIDDKAINSEDFFNGHH